MQFRQPLPPLFVARPHPAAIAVSGSLEVAIHGLVVRVTANGGQTNVGSMLSGYLHFSPRDGGVLTLHVARLGADGLPQELLPPYSMIRQMNPQILPLPARIHYRFANARTSLGEILRRQAEARRQPVLRDRHGDRAEAADLAAAETMIADQGAGLLLSAESWIGSLAAGDQLELRTEDYRCYSAVDQPLNIVGESIEDGAAAPSPPPDLASITHAYRYRDVDDTLDPVAEVTDHRANLVFQNGKLKIHHDDFLAEEEVVLHTTDGGGAHKQRFRLDPFERWALFDSALSWHVKNWTRSGFIELPPPVPASGPTEFFSRLAQAHGNLLPAHHHAPLNNYPGAGQVIAPPEPPVHDYPTGERLGRERPVYSIDVQRLRWHLDRHALDNFSAAPVRNFTRFEYRGADGIEEYVKRVACSEFAFGQDITGPDGEPSGVRLEREKAGFKAQIVAARTYLLAHWLGGTHGLTNPYANDFADIDIPEGPAFHVHRVQPLHAQARASEAFRLVLEEAWAEIRGIVITHRGRLIPTEYYAGDAAAHQTCPSLPEHITVVRTRYGIDCAQAIPGSAYMRAHGHGRGMSQNGSKTLSAAGLTFVQVLHWYFHGIQLRNGYGQGDVLTDPPIGHDWIVGAPPALPQRTVRVEGDRWISAAAIANGDDQDWRLSHHFEANEYCIDEAGAAIPLNVAARTAAHLQRVRYLIHPSRLRIQGLGPHRLLVECDHPDFQTVAEEQFGALTVTPLPAPPDDRWEISLP